MARGGFDYSEFIKFYENMQNFSTSFTSWLKQFIYKQGLKFIQEVRNLTPVDTGDLRNHWMIESVRVVGDDVQCWFVNSMEYATFVEYGHAKPYKSGAAPGSEDWVDGYFMMTISLDKIYSEMPKEFDAEFIKFAKSMGIY